MSEQQRRELECCACNGCPDCEHDCGLPPEEAQANHEHIRACFDHMAGQLLDEGKVKICVCCGAYFDPRIVKGDNCSGCGGCVNCPCDRCR